MRDFIKEYFDGKSGKLLRRTITPNWDSTDTHLRLLEVPKGITNVLEIGCGVGRLLREIYDRDEDVMYCIGYDASTSMVKESKKYIGNRNIQIFKVLGDGGIDIGVFDYFDFAFSFITFQHIPNIEVVKRYIREMYLFLKKGGIIKFQLLAKEELPNNPLWSYHNPDELMDYMKELGFKDIMLKHITNRWILIEGVK